MKLKHEFVKMVPEPLEQGVLYICMEYRVAIHSCCCGCGRKVVTPFSPEGWKLIFDGKTVSIRPSIGNWNFECRSHYWITNNQIEWDRSWSDAEIKRSRQTSSTIKTPARKGKGLFRKLFKRSSD